MSRLRSLALGCAVVALAACGSVSKTTAPNTTLPRAMPAGCALPRLPAPDSQLGLGGPAVTALQGGPARVGFALDGGRFTVTPPRLGDQPLASANQAECAAFASSSSNGFSIAGLGSQSGVAVGYGRVSIAPGLIAATGSTPYVARSGTNDNTNPRLPKATSYQQRLAWLVVVKNLLIYHGPLQPVSAPGETSTTNASTPPSYGYLVFVLDARTGSGALVYTEGEAGPFGSPGAPTVSVPAERVSVPWTLVSRSPDGYAGHITATVSACDGIPNPVAIDNGGNGLAVVVERPIGPLCATPTQVTLPVHASAVTADLPDHITHDPLGPVVALPSSSSQPSPKCSPTSFLGRMEPACRYRGPGATRGVLHQLLEFDNNSTIHITADSVLTVGPLHDATHYAALPVASSDTAVLGPLDDFHDYEINEFRAWHPGHADLFVPARGCKPNSTGRPCASQWIVHVTVT